MDYLNRKGSVEDIRCALSFVREKTPKDIERVLASVLDEHNNQKRITVIKMLNAKLSKLLK